MEDDFALVFDGAVVGQRSDVAEAVNAQPRKRWRGVTKVRRHCLLAAWDRLTRAGSIAGRGGMKRTSG
jgi:hypothetical protein